MCCASCSPYFRHSLKAGAFLSHLVWIMGPLSGLIVAPVIGVLSDRCTWRLGRRRPFIILGSVFSIVGMLIFANVIAITKGQLFIARLLAVFAFGLLDFSTNVIMFPSRALLGDLLPTYQQHDAQSAAAVIASIGEVCAGAYIYSLKDAVTNISRIFTIASILVAVSSSISIYFCQETPLTSSSSLPNTTTNTNLDSTQPNQSKHRNILTSVHTKNSQLKQHQQHNHDMHSSPIINGMRNGHSEQDEDIEMLTLNDDEPVPLSPLSANDVETSTTIPSRPHRDTNSSSTSNSTTVPTSTIDEKSILPSPSSPPSPATSHPAPPHLPLSTSVSTLPPPPSASLQPHTASSQGLRSELMSTIGTALVNFPRSLVPIGLVYGLAWFLWFASLPYYSQWIGEDVLGGDAHASAGSTAASLYQQGVQVFSIANMVKALTALVFAAFYPTIITCIGNIGERMVFSVSFFIFSSVLLICADSKDVYVAGFVVALGAIPFIVTQTIPIAIVVQRYPQNLASNLGVM